MILECEADIIWGHHVPSIVGTIQRGGRGGSFHEDKDKSYQPLAHGRVHIDLHHGLITNETSAEYGGRLFHTMGPGDFGPV